jgi:hypothetical protein
MVRRTRLSLQDDSGKLRDRTVMVTVVGVCSTSAAAPSWQAPVV